MAPRMWPRDAQSRRSQHNKQNKQTTYFKVWMESHGLGLNILPKLTP